MIGFIRLRERGSTPRHLAKTLRGFLKDGWGEAGNFFHRELRPLRFTAAHAAEAGYTKRKGENLPRGSKAYLRSYHGRKERGPFGGGRGQARPLVYTGESERAARLANVSATSRGVRVTYPGLRKFNRRNPRSRVQPNLEFRTILAREANDLADGIDATVDSRIRADGTTSLDTVTR